MSFELLVKAVDYAHPDPATDRRGAYKIGYPVVVMPYGHSWGSAEGPPKFIRIRCPDESITPEAARQWVSEWRDDFAYEVLDARPAAGQYDVFIYDQNAGAAGLNVLGIEKVERFLTGWGCTQIYASGNGVTFTFNLWPAARSSEFWDVPLIEAMAEFTLLGYDPATGIAGISIAIIDQEILPAQVVAVIERRGGNVVSAAHPNYVIELDMGTVFEAFKAEIKEKAQRVFCRRRYYFSVADVSAALAAGGVVSLSKSQILSRLKDKQAE